MAKNIPILSAKNIRLSVPGKIKPIISIPKLEIGKGKCLFILGENGAGKTSLLSILAGKTVPDSGEIFMHDKLIKPLSERLVSGFEGMELVEQSPQANPFLTVDENLEKALRQIHDSEKKKSKARIVKLCRLSSFLIQKTGSLSGGELRRLSVAMALATHPEIILLDEPFSDLDSQSRLELVTLLLEIKSIGQSALILVSHQAKEAFWLADEIKVLKQGKWGETLTPEMGTFHPKTMTAARLLGMGNLFSVKQIEEIMGNGFISKSSWFHLPESTIRFEFQSGDFELNQFQLVTFQHSDGSFHSLWKKDNLVLLVKSSDLPPKNSDNLFLNPNSILWLTQ